MRENYMKYLHCLLLTLFLTVSLSGCGNDRGITNQKAEKAIAQWLKNMGDNNAAVAVIGVQEVTQENSAKADITLSNFELQTQNGESSNYSGNATAIFIHYNDGRWVLSKIVTPTKVWDDLRIVATGENVLSVGDQIQSTLATQSKRSLFHKLTDYLGLTKAPPDKYGVYAFDNGRYTKLNNNMVPDFERRNFTPTVRFFIRQNPSNTLDPALISIVKLNLLRFSIHDNNDSKILAMPVEFEKNNQTLSHSPFTKYSPFTITNDKIEFSTNSVDDDQAFDFTPLHILNPGIYAIGDGYIFAVGLGDIPIIRNPLNGCVDIKQSEGKLQPCAVFDQEFKDTFIAFLNTRAKLKCRVWTSWSQCNIVGVCSREKLRCLYASNPTMQRLAPVFVSLVKFGDTNIPITLMEAISDVVSVLPVTPLMEASSDVVSIADDIKTIMGGRSLLEISTGLCNEEFTMYLLQHHSLSLRYFHSSLQELNTAELEELNTAELAFNTKILLDASRCSMLKVAGEMLKKGVDINNIDDNFMQSLPLVAAMPDIGYNGVKTFWKHSDNNDMVKLLLDHGADINIRGYIDIYTDDDDAMQLSRRKFSDITALHIAAAYGYTKSATILLSHKADIETKDSEGHTPLHVAAFRGNEDGIQLLLDHHANINVTNNKGETPLALAQLNKHTEAARLLVANGAH